MRFLLLPYSIGCPITNGAVPERKASSETCAESGKRKSGKETAMLETTITIVEGKKELRTGKIDPVIIAKILNDERQRNDEQILAIVNEYFDQVGVFDNLKAIDRLLDVWAIHSRGLNKEFAQNTVLEITCLKEFITNLSEYYAHHNNQAIGLIEKEIYIQSQNP